MDVPKEIKQMGNRVHMRRRALGLSQKELAKDCGFPYQVINRVENGHQDIYAQRLAKIAQHLGVSTDYLLGLKDDAESELLPAELVTIHD